MLLVWQYFQGFFFFVYSIRICMLLLFTCTLRVMNWDFNFISVFFFKLKGV